MNAIRARQKPIGPTATSMNGRRRPSGVWNVSLQGPITRGSVRAKRPSAARTAPISEVDVVYCPSTGGREAAVVVSDPARPSAPTPSLRIVATLEPSSATGVVADGETAADDIDDRPLCTG